MIQSKSARLVEIFRRLGTAPAAASADEAYRLLCNTIDAVEDEHSGTPNNPTAFRTDGRIYPPQEDHRKTVPGRPDLRRYASRGHGTLIGDNGAITILDRDRAIVFSKPGADGQGT